MKHLVFKLIAIGALGVASTLAHAQTPTNANTLDIAYAFGDNSLQFEHLGTTKMTETQGAAIIAEYENDKLFGLYDDVIGEFICVEAECANFHQNAQGEWVKNAFYYPQTSSFNHASNTNPYNPYNAYPNNPYNTHPYNPYSSYHEFLDNQEKYARTSFYNNEMNPWVRVVVNLGKRFVVGNGEKTLTNHFIENGKLVGGVIYQGVKHNNERRDTCPAQVKCIY